MRSSVHSLARCTIVARNQAVALEGACATSGCLELVVSLAVELSVRSSTGKQKYAMDERSGSLAQVSSRTDGEAKHKRAHLECT